jgi:plastocyanin
MTLLRPRARLALLVLCAAAAIACDQTMTGPAATPTPPSGPTPTPGPPQIVSIGKAAGGELANAFVDAQSGTSTSTIHAGDTIEWQWLSGYHSTTSGTCPLGCVPNGLWDSGIQVGSTFRHTFPVAGTFPYFCSVHGTMMQGSVIVQ